MKMVGDSLQEVPGGRQFVDEPRPVILPYDNGRILVGTRADGLFLADGTVGDPLSRRRSTRWLRTMDLYRGAELPDGTIALATTGGGMAIIDRQGRLLQHLDASTGVGDSLYYVLPRQAGRPVAGHGRRHRQGRDALADLRLRSHVGAPGGSVSYIHRHAGTLYVATSRGVYYLARRARRPAPACRAPAPSRRSLP